MNGFSLIRVGRFWHYRHQLDGLRVQRSTGETSRVKAMKVAERAYQEAVARSRGDEPCPTMIELVKLWLAAHEHTASTPHLKAVDAFGRLHLYGLADVLVKDLTTAQVEAARSQHLETHAPASGNHWLNILRLLVNWARRRRMMRERAWDVRNVKLQKKPRVRLPAALTVSWLQAFDAVAKPSDRLVVRMALGLGLREGEALGCRWEWLDWERRTYTPGVTKGREATPLPVPGWLLAWLEPQRKPFGWMAPGRHGDPQAEGRLRQLMAKANKVTGIEGLTPHRLRGTLCTQLLEAGVPMPDVQKLLRHKDLKTTARYHETSMANVLRGMDEISRRTGMVGQIPGEPNQPTPHQHREVGL